MITGETGAGKSIAIDELERLILCLGKQLLKRLWFEKGRKEPKSAPPFY